MSTRVTAVCCNMTSISANQCFIMSLITTQADHYLWDCVSDNLWIWPLFTNKWVAWYGFVLLTNLLFVLFLTTAKDEDKDCGKIFVSVQHSAVVYLQYQVTPSSSSPPPPLLPFLTPSFPSILPLIFLSSSPSLLLSSSPSSFLSPDKQHCWWNNNLHCAQGFEVPSLSVGHVFHLLPAEENTCWRRHRHIIVGRKTCK